MAFSALYFYCVSNIRKTVNVVAANCSHQSHYQNMFVTTGLSNNFNCIPFQQCFNVYSAIKFKELKPFPS